MRAVAVALVVAYHAGVVHLAGGYVGVDVFFVISGFLITGLLVAEIRQRGTLSFSRFYARRARRLLPMATLVLAVTAIAFSLVLLPLDRGGLWHDIRAATLYAANWHFAASSLAYGTDASVNPVLHYWSLSVEEQFYFGWPLLLFIVTRSRRHATGSAHVLRRVAIALSIIGVVSLGLSIALTPVSAPYAYYGLHTRAWELAAGGLLALSSGTLRDRTPAVLRAVMGWGGLIAVLFAAVRFSASTSFPGIAAALPVGGALLILAAGGPTQRPSRFGVDRLLSMRPVTYGGRISYSMYLWHWPCLIFLGTIAQSGRTRFSVAHGQRAALAVLIALALSVVSHHLLENPARLSVWMRQSGHSLAVGAAAMALTIVIAALLLPVSAGAIHSPVLANVTRLPIAGSPSVVPAADVDPVAVHVTLAMSPGQARGDLPSGTRDCYGGQQDPTAPAACEFGDPEGTRTMALVGDSHAEALFPALDAIAIANHWKLWLWAKPACPLIDLTVRLPQFDYTDPWCTTWQHNVLTRLAAIPHLGTVFVTHFGGVATIPGRFAVNDGPSLSASQVPAAWRRAWSTTDRQLSAVSRQVVVIRDTPQPLGDVPDCLDEHAPDEVPCSIPLAQATKDADVLYRAELPASTPTTRFIDLDAALCIHQLCPVITTDGDIVYRDGQHLTATVSAQLAPALAAQLNGIVPIAQP